MEAVRNRSPYFKFVRDRLDGCNVSSARSFLTVTYFKLNRLSIVKRSVSASAFDFGMMNEEIFAAVFRGDETITFFGVEPLYCTFTHIAILLYMVNS